MIKVCEEKKAEVMISR